MYIVKILAYWGGRAVPLNVREDPGKALYVGSP